MQFSTPGFIAQLKGALTWQRYKYATIFVDHYSRYGYIWLHRMKLSSEILEEKKNFEAHCNSVGVSVRHYHEDNARFCDNAFIQDAAKQGKTMSYCGVSAHHQNGIAEK